MDHELSFFQSAILPLGIFMASFLGSAHCIGMCGGLVLNFAPTKLKAVSYHFGRMLSYVLLGALAGWSGKKFIDIAQARQAGWIVSTVFAVTLIFIGLRRLQGRSFHFNFLPQFFGSIIQKLFLNISKISQSLFGVFSLGLFSAFLPCGWLYSFVFGAMATQSAVKGGLALFFFWMGTLPALTVTTMFFGVFKNFTTRFSGALLLVMGMASLGLHARLLYRENVSCHDAADSKHHVHTHDGSTSIESENHHSHHH